MMDWWMLAKMSNRAYANVYFHMRAPCGPNGVIRHSTLSSRRPFEKWASFVWVFILHSNIEFAPHARQKARSIRLTGASKKPFHSAWARIESISRAINKFVWLKNPLILECVRRRNGGGCSRARISSDEREESDGGAFYINKATNTLERERDACGYIFEKKCSCTILPRESVHLK